MNHFSDKSFRFLRALMRNNNREWFLAHKDDYEKHLKTPFQQLLLDLQPELAKISPRFRADPRGNGGSLFRIHRDTRFSGDKSPYKGWQGARLYHERRSELPAPSFYLHLQPGHCFVGAGIWHPEPATQRKIRQFIVENPAGWKAAAHAPAMRKRFDLESEEMLTRVPAGFPKDFVFADDLRHRNFVMVRGLDDADMTSPNLVRQLAKDFATLAPFVDYLCAALDLEF
ncbi:DUF2461 domain-containing protein [Solilutibacter silvestris]|uniref:TIGR02453 family protein n=1 Tax=Solilutibacter silvestris TaxID=1645665 RepID=A0A2K1PYP4_9GAMM|nr:DUF2461 domain-containing protein [Lysobacter silvestris]PNS07916.1 hypothetical protein Lysil_2092 [Lysobacter silvestris]